ncbi:MAG: SDR family NAD(P)-dependent oxidoreductase [Actinomycetota bacterium]
MLAWTTADIPDLTGRIAVVTGANSGLGLETTIGLAAAGATVVMGCRDERRGETARLDLANELVDRTEVLTLDLASGPSIERFAATVTDRFGKVDLLINNAGIMATTGSPAERADTAGSEESDPLVGLDPQWVTNHLGHFALTGRLLPLFVDRPARVVSVSSLAAGSGDPNRMIRSDGTIPVGGRYPRFGIYGDTKWANQVFALELNHRLAAVDSPAVSLAAHPGVSHTNLLAGTSLPGPLRRIGLALSSRLAQSAADGALPTLRAATDPAAEGGQYYGPAGRGQRRGAPKQIPVVGGAATRAHGRELWERSMALTGVRYLATGPS